MFRELAGLVKTELARHHNRPFLEATMAAAAMVALADGQISFSERSRIDSILERLESLKIFDVHDAIDLFDAFARDMRDDPQSGYRKGYRAVRRLRDNPESARLLIRICLAISQADGEFSTRERRKIVDLCELLRLAPADFKL